VRKRALVAMAMVVASLGAWIVAAGVAAQPLVERTEPAAGAVLERPPSSVDVWLEAPLSDGDEAELRVVHNQSGQRVDMGGGRLDPAEPAHLRVLLRPDLDPGKYVASWEVLSPNEEAKGSFSFTVADVSSQGNGDLVRVALATFGVAAGAMGVVFLGFLLRVRLGLVKPPPPPGEPHGSH